MIFVDRMEDAIAVLEVGENQFRRVERTLLPDDVREGSVLRLENGKYIHDYRAEKQRKEEMLRLQKAVFSPGRRKQEEQK